MRARELTQLEWGRMDLARQCAWLNYTKNVTPRGVPLNLDAIAILKEQQGEHAQYCFTCRGSPIGWDVSNTA
jgi:integrase